MKLLFLEDKKYGSFTYRKGKVYDISEENGMAVRWLKRGCQEVIEKESSEKKIKVTRRGKNNESSIKDIL